MTYIYIVIYMVSCPVLTVPPPWYGGGVGTRIRYTHCISTLCRLSTLPLPQYYKPPPQHRGGETYTLPQYHKPPPHHRGGGNPLLPPPMGGEGGGTGQHCTIYIYIYLYVYIYIYSIQCTIKSHRDLLITMTYNDYPLMICCDYETMMNTDVWGLHVSRAWRFWPCNRKAFVARVFVTSFVLC